MKSSDNGAPEAGLQVAPEEKRRGSHLLASAGVGIEKRRRSYQSAAQYHVGQNEVVFEDADGKQQRMQIVKIDEKQGNFRKAVPKLSVPVAILLCVLNVVLPGSGTFFGALAVLCGSPCGHDSKGQGVGYGMLAALLQLISFPLLVGWVWSIMYGAQMVQESLAKGTSPPPSAPNPTFEITQP